MVHPKLFLIAMGGAAVFALLTVASSFAIGRVIDDVILPRFDEGEVATSTVLAGLGLVIGIGVVRGHRHRDPAQLRVDHDVARRADLHQPGGAAIRRAAGQLAQPACRRRPGAARRGRLRGDRQRARTDPVRLGHDRDARRVHGVDARDRRSARSGRGRRVPAAAGHQRRVREVRLLPFHAGPGSARRVLGRRPRELRGCPAGQVLRRRGARNRTARGSRRPRARLTRAKRSGCGAGSRRCSM